MSRMTKFLKQTCSVELYQVDEKGEAVLNEFGELLYGAPSTRKCRAEPYSKDIMDSEGHLVITSTRYFLDNSSPIRVNDRIDGRAVLQCEGYTNQFGTLEGYEVYV